MKNLIKKTLSALIITAAFTSSATMAAGKPELVMQQLSSAHLPKSITQYSHTKEQAFQSSLSTKLDMSLEKSMSDIHKKINKELSDKLDNL
ncbi:hypothetical protein AMS58_09895 [Pseudoalteromonas porphyrae]|uniref:Uncharacterized protein n=2 Tax=Pseudoalteromonas TaxID=53246 RepID=A0A0N1EMQ9_9GAMM|nr:MULTISPECIES: hypothetical protein [Pseudoalteromonas]KPH62182.1 hypothetical protein ADS77_12850 [Pseudoalteromonas porphyrae]KPH94819.1 hypothetical protein AMS58_09895 [Pseudoalteromonas porphyrae]NMR25015.1 hypothetical protein [Pseudoalteromonas sp. NEC-BIFX-2020_015]